MTLLKQSFIYVSPKVRIYKYIYYVYIHVALDTVPCRGPGFNSKYFSPVAPLVWKSPTSFSSLVFKVERNFAFFGHFSPLKSNQNLFNSKQNSPNGMSYILQGNIYLDVQFIYVYMTLYIRK